VWETGEVHNRVLEGRSEGNGPLGRPRHKWEDIIKMDIQRMGWGGMDLTDLWRIFLGPVMKHRVP